MPGPGHIGIRGSVERGVESGRDRLFEIPERSQLVFELTELDLRADHIRVLRASHTVPGTGNLLELADQLHVLVRDVERSGQVVQLVVCVLDGIEQPQPSGLELLVRGFRLRQRDILAKLEFAEPGKRLCEPDSMALRPHAGLDTFDEVRVRQLRIRQRGYLR